MELADDLDAFGTSARRLLGDLNLSGAIRDGAPDLGARTGVLWAQAVALGWTGLMVPEAHGGSGLSAAYLVALATELGRACATGPFPANLALLPALCLVPSARAFAAELARIRDRGARRLVMLIGGADGLDPDLLASVNGKLAFGPQTWPHALARVMLAEQIYRAVTILAGGPYHRD